MYLKTLNLKLETLKLINVSNRSPATANSQQPTADCPLPTENHPSGTARGTIVCPVSMRMRSNSSAGTGSLIRKPCIWSQE